MTKAETKKRIEQLWKEEGDVIMEAANLIGEIEANLAMSVKGFQLEREPLERELFGDTRANIVSKTGTDPLTGKSVMELMAEMMNKLVDAKKAEKTKKFEGDLADIEKL